MQKDADRAQGPQAFHCFIQGADNEDEKKEGVNMKGKVQKLIDEYNRSMKTRPFKESLEIDIRTAISEEITQEWVDSITNIMWKGLAGEIQKKIRGEQ